MISLKAMVKELNFDDSFCNKQYNLLPAFVIYKVLHLLFEPTRMKKMRLSGFTSVKWGNGALA